MKTTKEYVKIWSELQTHELEGKKQEWTVGTTPRTAIDQILAMRNANVDSSRHSENLAEMRGANRRSTIAIWVSVASLILAVGSLCLGYLALTK